MDDGAVHERGPVGDEERDELRDLAQIQVQELPDRRDSFLQRTEYEVTATVRPPVVGGP